MVSLSQRLQAETCIRPFYSSPGSSAPVRRVREGWVQHVTRGECPYVIAYETDDEDKFTVSYAELEEGIATYGMRPEEFIDLIRREPR